MPGVTLGSGPRLKGFRQVPLRNFVVALLRCQFADEVHNIRHQGEIVVRERNQLPDITSRILVLTKVVHNCGASRKAPGITARQRRRLTDVV